jgi:prepilin-type N-terminal cleavage/methylation domain-containing protein/prepilin-type processing-associated H-X9-DG protein
MRQTRAPQVRAGFTLVELLVVVSIIALLISILLPSLRKAREQAKELKCAAQLASFGRGFYAYATSNDDYLCSGSFDPEVSNGRDGPLDRVGWIADLRNHKLAIPGEMLCPSLKARVNQKLGEGSSGRVGPGKEYTRAQADDLIRRGYNSNYTQAWYMGRTQPRWPNVTGDTNWKRVKNTLGPLKVAIMSRVSPSRVPLLGDGKVDDDKYKGVLGLGEFTVTTMTDGPMGGPYDPQNYSDFGPAHGVLSSSGGQGGARTSNRERSNILFGDAHVGRFIDKVRNGEFRLVSSTREGEDWVQEDLDPQVFDGVLTLGRRSKTGWELK